MKIFVKYILKSMFEKKARLILLIFAIAVSTGLFIGSMGAVQSAIESFTKPILQSFEGKEVMITTTEKNRFYAIDDLQEKGITGIQPSLVVNGLMDTDNMENVIIHSRELAYINKNELIEKPNWNTFSGNKAIISQRISNDLTVKEGDNIDIIINGENLSLTVVGISANTGLFYPDQKNDFAVITPYDFLEEQLGASGKYNFILAEGTEENIKESITTFNESNPNFKATELFDEEVILDQLEQITGLFYAMLVIVVLMSSVIIYGSFKLTITERLPVIGTFFSQGATRGNIKKVLYLESAFYGILGGVLGSGFGIGILYLIHYLLSPLRDYGIVDAFTFNHAFIMYGLMFAFVISIASCTIPIFKTDKYEVKDVILNSVDTDKEQGWIKFAIGSVILIAVITINILSPNWAVDISPFLLLISLVGLIMTYPKLMDVVTDFIFHRIKGIFKVTGLAINNTRSSRALRGNVTLLIISILAMVLINSAATSLKGIVIDAFTSIDFDISIRDFRINEYSSRELLVEKLKENPNIDANSIQQIFFTDAKIEDANTLVIGMDPSKYKNYNHYFEFNSGRDAALFSEFENSDDRVVMVTTSLADRSGVSEGDHVKLTINGWTHDYKVLGTFDGGLYFTGNFFYINSGKIKEDFNFHTSQDIVFNTLVAPDEVKSDIEGMVREFGGTPWTFEEARDLNLEQNKQLMDLLSIFSLMAVVIGALGAINNMIISFIQRKKELAILSSIGMTTKQRAYMIMSESFICVIWAIAILIPYCYLAVSLVSKFTRLIGLPMEIQFELSSMIYFFVASIIIFFVATLPVIFRNKKLSVIEEIKYE
ncbi:FtsX-like permease family protein [Serpentinicella sp. ANB-PHB4]|uniref:ABC transporter permease n=1 Tax=Serpentinicella sp. ANB-PHB4 TaxID=3074076 RepID=UPI002858AD20|nr:FtsX-like permease family protein [Serpentinicella sp. ANB-PHB4]MDR5658499.1 FtsX-like permease family protein [Serpentinicella sp. ANB-PHB4]